MYSCFSHIQLFEGAHRTLCTLAHQSLLSMVFSRQEYWSRLCHALLQGIFKTQGSNLGFLLWRWILYCSVTREDLILCILYILCIHTYIYSIDTEHQTFSQIANTEIRLIMFFAAEHGEYGQHWKLTVAQIMNSLLQN